MNRSEHLEWCKSHALEYIKVNDPNQAFVSMVSDLGKHPETKDHPAIQLGLILSLGGQLNSVEEMRKFIEGFN
jgi:hypothetical protein